jgi:hypothetical protein
MLEHAETADPHIINANSLRTKALIIHSPRSPRARIRSKPLTCNRERSFEIDGGKNVSLEDEFGMP